MVHILARKCRSGERRTLLTQPASQHATPPTYHAAFPIKRGEAVETAAVVALLTDGHKSYDFCFHPRLAYGLRRSTSSQAAPAKRKQSNKERILFRFCNFFFTSDGLRLRPYRRKRRSCTARRRHGVVQAAGNGIRPSKQRGEGEKEEGGLRRSDSTMDSKRPFAPPCFVVVVV